LDVLSRGASRTLFFLFGQYNGWNNGNFSIAPKICKEHGIPKTTARRGAAELAHWGLIVETRQGSLNKPSLFGVAWLGLDKEVDFKFDEGIEASSLPLPIWKREYRSKRTLHLVVEHENNLASRKGGRWNKDPAAPPLRNVGDGGNRRASL
jgi:hypothetical protein